MACNMLPAPQTEYQDSEMGERVHKKNALTLCNLPDELISMCYSSLPATDLVSLEYVSSRLRHLVSTDSICWARCAEERWGSRTSTALLSTAARHAGSWKKLYASKVPCDQTHAPWLVPCSSETAAMLELIKGYPVAKPAKPQAGSPRALSGLRMCPRTLSVVLLIDGSSSVTEEDFKAMKEFATSLVNSLNSTHPDSALALVQFNQHPKVECQLTPVARGSLRHTIAGLDQMMGSTDIAAPIRRARELLENESTDSAKAIVLLTDGQTHADELQESEREARAANRLVGARVFTLGVGRDVDVPGLTRVATGNADLPEDVTPEMLAQGAYFTLRCLSSQ